MAATLTNIRLTSLAITIIGALHQAPAAAAAVNWVPNADGFWDVVANWSTNPILPEAVDDVTIDVGGARFASSPINAVINNE